MPKEANPDIILAEPVGSCMDISATVIGPVQTHYRDRFTLVPLLVLVDASVILDISRELNLSSPQSQQDISFQTRYMKQKC